jgi:hypothetical protein
VEGQLVCHGFDVAVAPEPGHHDFQTREGILMQFRELDFHADGLKPNRIQELMGLMNTERARASAAVEESLRGAGDEADVFATVGVRRIRAITWQARDARWNGVKDLAKSCGIGGVIGWFVAACALSLFIVATSDLHVGWKVFAGLPILAGAGIGSTLFAVALCETVREAFRDITPLVTGRYPDESVGEMVYRAGSVWALGSNAIHIHSSRPFKWGWEPELRSVPYNSIQSIEIHRQSGQISIRVGEDCFALFEVECRLRAEDIASEIISRARADGHEIPRMNLRSKSMDGLGREVSPDILERFSRTHPGVKVVAPNSGLESTLEVHMERADEVDMGRRIADFEGFPITYFVPRRHSA